MLKISKVIRFINTKIIKLFFSPIFFFVFKENIWNIYNSHNSRPKLWKTIIWNKYMELHSASISLEAKIKSPLTLPHGVSGIFITRSSKIGKNVVIFQQVTIGANTIKGSKSYGAPTIGDNVYIGAGAKIIGNVTIGNNCRIGANAIIVEDIPSNSLVVLEKPKVITKNNMMDNTFTPYLE